MDYQQLHQHKLNNTLQSVLLIASMAILLGVVGGLFAGPVGVWLALTVCALLLAFGPQLSPRFVLSLYRAQPIDRRQAPDLHMLTTELSRRAGLARTPQLYYIPSRMMNAFAVGSRDDAAIGLTDGLLRRLLLGRSIGRLLGGLLGKLCRGFSRLLLGDDRFELGVRLAGGKFVGGLIRLFLLLSRLRDLVGERLILRVLFTAHRFELRLLSVAHLFGRVLQCRQLFVDPFRLSGDRFVHGVLRLFDRSELFLRQVTEFLGRGGDLLTNIRRRVL